MQEKLRDIFGRVTHRKVQNDSFDPKKKKRGPAKKEGVLDPEKAANIAQLPPYMQQMMKDSILI